MNQNTILCRPLVHNEAFYLPPYNESYGEVKKKKGKELWREQIILWLEKRRATHFWRWARVSVNKSAANSF